MTSFMASAQEMVGVKEAVKVKTDEYVGSDLLDYVIYTCYTDTVHLTVYDTNISTIISVIAEKELVTVLVE